MTDEHKVQSDGSPRLNTQDEHKQSTSHPTDTTSPASTSSASASPPPTSSDPAAMAAVEEMLTKDITRAEAFKAEGNTHFTNKRYTQAIDAYTQAILLTPNPTTPTPTATVTTATTADTDTDTSTTTTTTTDTTATDNTALHTLLATLYSNRAAAHLNLSHYPETIADTTHSITHTPTVKAHLRRSIALENQQKYSEAIQDITAAITMGGLDGKGSGVKEEEERKKRLEGLRKEKEEEQKAEMLSKLKDLGNGLLGKFGMSLDSFKAVKDPNTGSYSISFKQ